jgi:hypothetical protein
MKTYLYLAKRDKKGIKIVSVFQGNKTNFQKINDTGELGLPKNMEDRINQVKHNERMNWELYVESAEDFKSLLHILGNRGYRNLPTSPKPIFYEFDFYSTSISDIEIKDSMLRRKD